MQLNTTSFHPIVKGRPPRKRHAIAVDLCSHIVAGRWKPGERIPTLVELEELFHAGNPTIHQAVKTLMSAGFIETRGRNGTFVVPHPPHLSRYALVFPENPYSRWSRFWEAMRQGAGLIEHMNGGQQRQFPIYFNIDKNESSKDYLRLTEHIRLPALAGIIFANAPWKLGNVPLLTKPGIPRIAIATETGSITSTIPTRYPDLNSFHRRAIEFLTSPKGGNRRRIAMLNYSLTPGLVDYFNTTVANHGATTGPYWIQSPNLGAAAIKHAIQGLLHAEPGLRPDGLIIADDNYVEHATQALAQMGLQTPEKIGVVAFSNFPAPPPSAVPVTRLGFNVCDLLEECANSLDHIRRGETVAQEKLIPAIFEEEIL